jgi:hypothetical protein
MCYRSVFPRSSVGPTVGLMAGGVTEKKSYSENYKMTFLEKKNPRIDALIPNVMYQMLKIS